ncbi:MAG: Uma2 family endonuclease, partial [Acetatifactor sp.]|nr:Uma2 family endonuclease [Acetatifactor sp.]
PAGGNRAPDRITEILSPSSQALDYITKRFHYRTAACREYWIVDPLRQRVTVYFFEKEVVEEYSFGTDIPVGIYKGFSIKAE